MATSFLPHHPRYLDQHLGQFHCSDLGDQLWSVEGAGSEPGGHVEDVGGSKLEVDQSGVEVSDDGGEEFILSLVRELQNSGQNLLFIKLMQRRLVLMMHCSMMMRMMKILMMKMMVEMSWYLTRVK